MSCVTNNKQPHYNRFYLGKNLVGQTDNDDDQMMIITDNKKVNGT